MKKNKPNVNKGARIYLKSAIKAASHPIRNKILKILKAGPKSTPSLEEETGENRYNLYHHLDVLVNSGLVKESNDPKKIYSFNTPKNPNTAVFIFNEDDFMKDFSTWDKMLDGLEKIEGGKVPIRGKIIQAEICLTYR
mgnify:CR=1 FL=1